MGAAGSSPRDQNMLSLSKNQKTKGHYPRPPERSAGHPQERLVEILLAFAHQHFRHPENVTRSSVKYTKKPLSQPLLPHSGKVVDETALEIFKVVLTFMGDLPCILNSEVILTHRLLQMCRDRRCEQELQLEAYCQILKQLTYTCSSKSDRYYRAWQLLYTMSAYCSCPDSLQGTVRQYLRTVGAHGNASLAVAKACYQQLERTRKIGGRSHYPSPMEVKALLTGRSQRWIFVNIPGGSRQALRVNMGTTLGDVIFSLCTRLGVSAKERMSAYGITWAEDEERLGSPLGPSLYVLDLLQEMQALERTPCKLWFYRIHWEWPLELGSRLCVEMQYHQVLRLYEAGQLLMRKEHAPISQAELASRMAALKHLAGGASHPPNRCEVKASIPADLWPAYSEDYWMKKVLACLEVFLEAGMSPTEAKNQFLDIAISFPLFGTTLLEIANSGVGEARAQLRTAGTKSEQKADWAQLPEQALVHLYSLVPFPNKSSMSLTCRAWAQAFSSPGTWQKVVISVKPTASTTWILMLKHYGHFIEFAQIIADCKDGQCHEMLSSIIDELAHSRNSRLRRLTLTGFCEHLEDLQKNLEVFFDVAPIAYAGITELDFTNIAGQFEDSVFLSLARNHPSLEKLLVANKQPAIRIQPKTLLSILRSCRRLSHLAVWSYSLSDGVVETFLEKLRAPLQLLQVFYDRPIPGSGIISNNVWKKLRETFPDLHAHLHFTVDIPVCHMLDVLQSDIPAICIEISSTLDLSRVLKHVTEHYHPCLRRLSVQGPGTPDMLEETVRIQKLCRKLKEVKYNLTGIPA
ncbi:unconventional myosin-XV-like isoform X2 [Rhinatrema bivittatum]|uniref:unconventional myosin-XV-like isoform X2 n=1 Tax=Rhinatrema bivittatum TaxID=194408 RepID=UPI001127EE0D|nr:unconventional myosin-XV-like isoform X2 [Rhinatrema bivittatum]